MDRIVLSLIIVVVILVAVVVATYVVTALYINSLNQQALQSTLRMQ